MNSDLDKLLKKLNSEEFSPEKGYRRNVAIYELVCYVNNITGCFLSNNFSVTRVFINRARCYITDNEQDLNYGSYYKMVERYLKLIDEKIGKRD